MRISDWSSDVCSSDLAKKATNEAVPETWYKRMLAIAYDAKRMDLAVPASPDQVSAYTSADNWPASLIIFRATGKLDDTATLDRSDERRGGKECVRMCRSRWQQQH